MGGRVLLQLHVAPKPGCAAMAVLPPHGHRPPARACPEDECLGAYLEELFWEEVFFVKETTDP